MKKADIKQLPLLFLFAPTLVAAITIYLFLNYSFQANYELQLKANAEHIVARLTRLSHQHLYNRRYSVLKQELEDFVSKTDSAIDNIVIYNKSGQFVTALKLNQAVLNSSLNFPEAFFVRQGSHYLAVGRIGALPGSQYDPLEETTDIPATGFVRVSFNADPAGQRSQDNHWVVLMIVVFCIVLGVILWRQRYAHFHHQLVTVNDRLANLNKGYKYIRLPDAEETQFDEINNLHRHVNDFVCFYEKRLTMKHFEVTALEQNLHEADDFIALKKVEFEQLQAQQSAVKPDDSDKSNEPHLMTTIYQAVYQVLQTKLALIDNLMLSDEIDNTISQLNQLLNEIKRLADISAGQLKQQREVISSPQLVSSISRLVATQAHNKGLEFIICQPQGPLSVEVDVNQVQQVMIALLQSAIGTTHHGYIKLTVELTEWVNSGDQRSAKVCYKIQDSGVGFSPAQYRMLAADDIDQSLFDDGWIDQGLSLLVAKKTVEAMGGEFKLKSLTGLGAELSMELTTKVQDYHEPVQHEQQIGCMLLYDPVDTSADVIFDQLYSQGILTILCVNSQEVQEALAANEIDCAIFCRPVSIEPQQTFDASMGDIVAQIVAQNKLDKCLFVTAGLPEAQKALLPASWQVANKPFVFSDLTRYFDFSQLLEQHAGIGEQQAPENLSDSIEILAVDDNETNLKLLSVILRAYPVNLVQALSGREALVKSQKQVFDLILMDKEMPEMDGMQTSRHIRQQALNKQTPIVAFTAHITDGERNSLIGEVINDCLEKPLDPDKFYYLMDTWCKTRWGQIGT